MKKIEVTEEFYNAALLLAQHVDGDNLEFNSFLEFIKTPSNKREDHIYYQAGIVGGWCDTLNDSDLSK